MIGLSPLRRSPVHLTAALALAALACASSPSLAPDPSHSPADVVRFQVEALAGNEGEDGIATTFRFASPANKRMTGPLERFVGIVRAPAYRAMLNHLSAEYGETYVAGDFAAQVVSITARDGSRHVYRFELSRQRGGEWAGCWMTDSVYVLDAPEEPGLAI